METSGIVLSIERFSLNDGPGIRTTVFLKGCPLNCLWCHNPESKKRDFQLSYRSDSCTRCRMCMQVCEFGVHSFLGGEHQVNFNQCTLCGKCIDACPTKALKISGRKMSVSQVMDVIVRDIKYYNNTGGGVTLSGGEPMLQFDFTLEMLKKCKEKSIHTCMETSGFSTQEKYIAIAEYTDMFLFDIKAGHVDYKKYTGVDKQMILDNLYNIAKTKAEIILRCPMIPEINDNEENFNEIIELAQEIPVKGIELMPYHDIGKSKARQTGEEYPEYIKVPDNDTINKWIDRLSCTNILLNIKK